MVEDLEGVRRWAAAVVSRYREPRAAREEYSMKAGKKIATVGTFGAALKAMGIAPELQGAIINLAFEVIWEMPVHRACNRNDTEYDARAA